MRPPRLHARRSLTVTGAGLALLLTSLLFDAAPLFVPAIALIIVGLGAPAWVWCSVRGAEVTRRLPTERVVEEQPLAATIEVRRGWLGLPGAEVVDPFTGSRLGVGGPLSMLRGGSSASVRVVTRFARRGLHTLSPPLLVVSDPLELARAETVSDAPPQQLLVLPRTGPVRWVGAGRARRLAVPDGHATSEAMAAVDLDGLRPYRPGTPASRIHWPALARGAGLIERRLRADGDTRPLIVLDARLPAGRRAEELLDAAVRAAASLTLELARAGGCGLLLPGEQRPTTIDPGLKAWPAAYARLAVVRGAGARAPALGPTRGRLGAMVYVAVRAPERLVSLNAGGEVGTIVLVLPTATLRDGRPRGISTAVWPMLEVTGCRGFALGARTSAGAGAAEGERGMSAGTADPAARVNVAPRFERTEIRPAQPPSAWGASLIRLVSFAALGGYGVVRWATLLTPAPAGRLLGLLGLAVALAGVVPLLRRIGPPPAIAAAVGLSLLALPVAGLSWHDFLHLRLAAGTRAIGNGLSGLPGSFVPYEGLSHDIRTVISLGAAVLLLDGAIVLAFSPSRLAEGRRAGAALPLIALAVVPSTLLRPQLPYVQGFILFVLLVLFVWGERAQSPGRRAALMVLIGAGLVATVIAPRVDARHPWLDYRSWTGSLAHPHLEQFAWNQNYGPLHWPRSGHVVLTVRARRADYWKAEDLDVFDGYGWVAAPVAGIAPAAPSAAALAKWTQPIEVSLTAMTSAAVIAAGYAGTPSLPYGTAPSNGAGTWVSYRPLGPGTHYTVQTYSPNPTPAQLAHAGDRYPLQALAAYRTLTIPEARVASAAYPQITFAQFRAGRPPALQGGDPDGVALVRASPYAGVFSLARQLAAGARTPYGYAMVIARYLDRHYAYNENPPARRYPLASFLFTDKIGYCQQFSGAMAMLLRMGGVPARVAAGFTSGTRDRQGRFEVTDIDAHAWVEAWFPRYGWVRFDPTPAIAPARGGNSAVQFVKNLPGGGTTPSAVVRRDSTSTPGRGAHHGRPAAGGATPWLLLPAGLGVIFIGLLVASVLQVEPGTDEQLRELERALARTGRPIGPEVTLAVLEQRFHDAPVAVAYIRGLRLARYGGDSLSTVPGGRRALRDQLRHGLGVTGRLRALWALPPRRRGRAGRAPGNHLGD